MTLLSALHEVMHSLRMAGILSKFFNYRPPRWKNAERVDLSIHQSAHECTYHQDGAGGGVSRRERQREGGPPCMFATQWGFLSAELSEFCCISSGVGDMNIHEVILSLVKASCCSTEGSG